MVSTRFFARGWRWSFRTSPPRRPCAVTERFRVSKESSTQNDELAPECGQPDRFSASPPVVDFGGALLRIGMHFFAYQHTTKRTFTRGSQSLLPVLPHPGPARVRSPHQHHLAQRRPRSRPPPNRPPLLLLLPACLPACLWCLILPVRPKMTPRAYFRGSTAAIGRECSTGRGWRSRGRGSERRTRRRPRFRSAEGGRSKTMILMRELRDR